jgi:predicted N-acetyltransferase YhbS
VLVLPDEQRDGVGRALVQAVLDRYRTVRQKVLLTDDEPDQRAFYEALGYAEAGSRNAAAADAHLAVAGGENWATFAARTPVRLSVVSISYW